MVHTKCLNQKTIIIQPSDYTFPQCSSYLKNRQWLWLSRYSNWFHATLLLTPAVCGSWNFVKNLKFCYKDETKFFSTEDQIISTLKRNFYFFVPYRRSTNLEILQVLRKYKRKRNYGGSPIKSKKVCLTSLFV